MTSSRVLSCAVGCLFLTLLVSSSGCVIFEPVGNAISHGYQNTVAYFNSYYNASRLFNDAEDEIQTAQRTARSKGIAPEDVPVPPGARQKLTTVIDKCSNVLSFYPNSTFVDDALFLIGKSYYYQGDFLKAERKFAEMLSQYPNSNINLDARLWYLKTLNRLKKDEEANRVAATLLQAAEEQGEEEIAAEGYANVGEIDLRQEQPEKALESYRHAIRLSSDDEWRAEIQSRVGAVLFDQGKFGEAAAEFAKVSDFTSEPSLVFSSRISEIRSLRLAGELTAALQRCDELMDDYRFLANTQQIRFERGVTLVKNGDLRRGMDELTIVDTTAARTEVGARAAFELGMIYEQTIGDLATAKDEFSKSLTFPVPDILPEARKHQLALTRYLSLTSARERTDSVLALVDSVRQLANVDSAGQVLLSLSPDSLKEVCATHAYGVGEVFYADLDDPDSAIVWYRRALEVEDSVRTPRIKYILAEMAAANPDKHYGDSKTMFEEIVRKYPRSIYAMRANIQLGVPVDTVKTDPGKDLYKQAEALLDSGNTRGAMSHLRTIAREYPLSPFAPKSVYTIGWLYEHILDKPDSALSEYRMLVQTYAASSYAGAIKSRIPAAEVAPPDSTRQLPKPEKEERESEKKEGAKKKSVVRE